MEILFDHFPVFQANQVLTSGHLNDVFNYLDQQERQTRSHLIGIGIVCGLEIKFSGGAIALSKGCGVTSEGYLIIEPEEYLSLVAYRSYTPPSAIDYPEFKAKATAENGKDSPKWFDLWELFKDGVANTTPLNSPANFLDDKAVLLFLELKKEPLRTCSPNSCDDKGSQVTANLRRLLILKRDLENIIGKANDLDSGLTTSDIDAVLSARLNLPDLRLRRFGLNTSPVTSNDIYTAFLDMVRTGGLAKATSDALTAAYMAFKPLIAGNYQTNPFTDFITTYGFLDSTPANVAQVKFLQYYVDLFDDLLRAYDEFRWKGLELICACCPDDGLFPRHLMLGLPGPATAVEPGKYRQAFLPSPAMGDCANKTKEVLQLFARLVEMAARFTDAPELPKAIPLLPIDPQIRLTPSTLCCCGEGLESKAIPYYYSQKGTPPLYRLWSPTKTQRHRSNQNFSYNADLYTDPLAPPFITEPLSYDFEPLNFLRVEGHLGKDYQHVMQSLLALKSQYRLPIDIIALRTGAYDDSQPVDLSKEAARFQDLEAIYEALRGDLMSELVEGVMELYDRGIPAIEGLTLNGGTPKHPLLKQYAPHYNYAKDTVGSWYENYLTLFTTLGYIDIEQNVVLDQSAADPPQVASVYFALFSNKKQPEKSAFPHVAAIYYITKLAEIVTSTLDSLNYADFENKYEDLMWLIRFFRSRTFDEVKFIDFCEGILFGCKLDALKAIHDEYVRRIGELKKGQFLSNFLSQHPGIQHKAGVPMGGTFIIVYHGVLASKSTGLPGRIAVNLGVLQNRLRQLTAAEVTSRIRTIEPVDTAAVIEAIGNISANRTLIANEDVSLLLGLLTSRVPIPIGTEAGGAATADPAAKIIGSAVDDLAKGTVIADFFLPYQISSGFAGIQYVLPKETASFTVTVGCTAENGSAAVTIDAKGGVQPYDVAVDEGAYQALGEALSLPVGEHRIKLRDDEGTETPAQTITVPPPIIIGEPHYVCLEGDQSYQATASITGGTPPYGIVGDANATVYDSTGSAPFIFMLPIPSGTAQSVTIKDSKGCTATAVFNHTCPEPCSLPCAGISVRRDFRFFIPDADPNNAYKSLTFTNVTFLVESAQGESVDLSEQVAEVLQATPDQLSAANFSKLVDGWMQAINRLIAINPDLNKGGVRWLTFNCKVAGAGRLGLFLIEYFKCLNFYIKLDLSYAQASGDTQTFIVVYTPDGTSILDVNREFTIDIPAFDGTTTDKCKPDTPATPLCGKQDFRLAINIPATTSTSNTVTFEVIVDPPNRSDLSFLWEVPDGAPAIGNGQSFKTKFRSSGTKTVIVTAFTKEGCSVREIIPITLPVIH